MYCSTRDAEEKGIKKGEKRGEKRSILNIAKKLLSMNYGKEQIKEIIGLSENELNNIII